MILAAGLGTRLRPLTEALPKPLLPVGGRPLIYYNLLLLKKYGITDILINVHHHAKKIIDELGNGNAIGMHISYSEEAEILGTGGGIKKAQAFLDDGAFLVINGDILVDIDLDRLVAFHQKKGGMATLVLRDDPDLMQYGAIDLDDNDQIQNILGKATPAVKTRKKMFTGIHIIEPSGLDYIPAGKFYSIIDAYLAMLHKGEKLFGYSMQGYWNDIGVPERYYAVNQAMDAGKICLSYIPSTSLS